MSVNNYIPHPCNTKITKPGYYKGEERDKDIALFNSLIQKNGEADVLDIGCKSGNLKFPGATGLDIAPNKGIEVVHSLEEYPYPFSDNTFDIVIANHIFEHIEDLPRVMEELYRILKTGGHLIIRTPFFLTHGSYDDPTHIRHYTLRSIDFFCVESKWKFKNNDAWFNKVYQKLFFGSEAINPGRFVMNISPRYYEKYVQYWFPGNTLMWVLKSVNRPS